MKTPTTSELYEALSRDFRNELKLDDNPLREVLGALAMVLSAQFKLVYLFLSDIQNNLFPDTADPAEFGGELERLGRIYLNRDPNSSTAGVYGIALTGETDGIIRAELTFKANEDSNSPGQLFIADEKYTLTGNNDMVTIRALVGGTESELLVSDQLTITEPVIGVDKTVTVTEVIERPKEAESLDEYRQKILDAIQLEPQGGAKTDYRLWASDAQGVRKVFPYLKEGDSGTVQIFVEAKKEDSTDGLGTPSQNLLDEVLSVIEFDPDESKPDLERGRRPIQAIIEPLPISLVPVDVEITGLFLATTEIQSSIENNLKEFLRDVRPFVAGADLIKNKNDILYAARLQSVLTDVIDRSNFFEDFVMKVEGNAATSVQFSRADIPYLRNVDYL